MSSSILPANSDAMSGSVLLALVPTWPGHYTGNVDVSLEIAECICYESRCARRVSMLSARAEREPTAKIRNLRSGRTLAVNMAPPGFAPRRQLAGTGLFTRYNRQVGWLSPLFGTSSSSVAMSAPVSYSVG